MNTFWVVDAFDSATSGLIAGRLGGNGTGSKHVSEGIKKIFKTGNFKYYFSQTKTLLKRETKAAVRGIFKSAIPAFLDIAISAAIKYGGGS